MDKTVAIETQTRKSKLYGMTCDRLPVVKTPKCVPWPELQIISTDQLNKKDCLD
jgi:hypothetical protein